MRIESSSLRGMEQRIRTATQAAHCIRTERLVLRRWEERDAELLKEAVDSSLDHLRPWMLWAAQEPEAVDAKRVRIRSYRASFDEGADLVYGTFDLDETRVLGAGGLHDRLGEGAREIGYWIRADSLRCGYATEMAAALTRVGFEIGGLSRIEIHCDPRNVPSLGVPRRLGYRHVRTLLGNQRDSEGRKRDTMVWRLLARDYGDSFACRAQVEADLESGPRVLESARG